MFNLIKKSTLNVPLVVCVAERADNTAIKWRKLWRSSIKNVDSSAGG